MRRAVHGGNIDATMNRLHPRLLSIPLAALAGGVVALSSAPAHALVFQFQFDGVPDGRIDPPIVGTGSFSFDGDPGTGSFALDSLANYTFNFAFSGGDAYGNRNIVTPTSEVLVLISKSGNSLKLNFSNTNGFGSGPGFGSIDFFNGANTLSFEPPGFGGNLDLYFASPYFGNYSASAPGSGSASVPGPLPLMGVAAAFGWSRRLRRSIANSTFKL